MILAVYVDDITLYGPSTIVSILTQQLQEYGSRKAVLLPIESGSLLELQNASGAATEAAGRLLSFTSFFTFPITFTHFLVSCTQKPTHSNTL